MNAAAAEAQACRLHMLPVSACEWALLPMNAFFYTHTHTHLHFVQMNPRM